MTGSIQLLEVDAGFAVLRKSRNPDFIAILSEWDLNVIRISDVVRYCHSKFPKDQAITTASKRAVTLLV